ncbi:hypothetical protein Taro_005208 [Colocasia esculenta]|uniref:Aminotransferase-like plant mobile domain-containing protein n=1 Tax=Colocasia esculenta TaxID=4460 RepID=A0A843TX88_COLES|nr:hypothetical protein [Colocasia esculenta]
MLNDDADSTEFYSANERDVRYESYDYTLPTDYNPMHHVTKEHKGHLITIVAIVANQDIIEVHVQGYNPLITISFAEMDQLPGPVDTFVLYAQDSHRSQLVYASHQTEVLKCWEHHRSLGGWPVDPCIVEYIRWEPYTFDILQILPAVSRQASHLWLSRVPLLSFSIVEMHVPDRVLRQFGRVHHIPGPVDALDRVTRKGRGHIDWARYFTHFVQMWHCRTDYIIPPDEETVGIGRVEYMSWYWSITRRYIGRSGFTYDMRYEPRDHIEMSLVEGMKHLHMMATDGLQDDMISDSTQSRYIAMQMYIDSVLSQVQRTDSSTSDAGPSEPCASTPQQPDDAGPPQFSPDVMTVSQYGLYDVRALQLLTDEGMPDTQPPQSTIECVPVFSQSRAL